MNLPQIDRPIVVEGKYDKIRLETVVSATILTTDGFGIFRSDEKKQLIRSLAMPKGVLVLTDPDGAGLVIRNFLRGILPQDKVTHLYIPKIPGKEKRKAAPSGEGLLGVEGMDKERLFDILSPYFCGAEGKKRGGITKTDFYLAGYSGGSGSRKNRKRLSKALDLPDNLSANALLEAVNLLLDRTHFLTLCATENDSATLH